MTAAAGGSRRLRSGIPGKVWQGCGGPGHGRRAFSLPVWNYLLFGEVPLKVVYHDPCHARHGQGIISEPRQLLGRIPGLQLVEPLEPEVCCGSGGAWGLDHPDLSQSLGRRKAADLAATGADLVLTSNPGCLGQIADGLALEAPDLTIMPSDRPSLVRLAKKELTHLSPAH